MFDKKRLQDQTILILPKMAQFRLQTFTVYSSGKTALDTQNNGFVHPSLKSNSTWTAGA